MLKHVIHDKHQTYTRITKREALKRWNANEPIYIIAHKMRPGSTFKLGMKIFPKSYTDEGKSFDYMLNSFCVYNANCHETGTYAAFYTVSG